MQGRLLENPGRIGKALGGAWSGYRAGRVGPYRVIYRIDEGARVVQVVRVSHRSDAYRGGPRD